MLLGALAVMQKGRTALCVSLMFAMESLCNARHSTIGFPWLP